MRLDAPAAKAEVELLKTMKVGDRRNSLLIPALDVDASWLCVAASEKEWEFDVTVLGQPLFKMKIVQLPETITLEVKEFV